MSLTVTTALKKNVSRAIRLIFAVTIGHAGQTLPALYGASARCGMVGFTILTDSRFQHPCLLLGKSQLFLQLLNGQLEVIEDRKPLTTWRYQQGWRY